MRATPVARATLGYVLAPAALVGAAEAAYAALLIHDPVENPQRAPFAGVFFARAGALTALALGVIWSVLRAWRARRTVARLPGELGEMPAPGAFRSLLARSLGDDRLDVAYWIPSAGRYVDDGGHPVSPAPGPEQAATAVVRGGEPVALVVHDRALQAQHDLDREIGAAARLAVDNERLRAETLVQLERLRASRARVVAMADTTRRQLERDLHDGAQQTLLAVLYELRLAGGAAVTAGNLDLAKALAQGSREAELGLDELRDLAHGIFPAILTEAGLGPALWTLADQAPIPIEIDEVVEARYPAGAETAAYLVVRDAVDDAATRAATHVVARVDATADRLVVEVRDDGGARSSDGLVHLADRVGALGGRMDVHGPRVRAEIPCA